MADRRPSRVSSGWTLPTDTGPSPDPHWVEGRTTSRFPAATTPLPVTWIGPDEEVNEVNLCVEEVVLHDGGAEPKGHFRPGSRKPTITQAVVLVGAARVAVTLQIGTEGAKAALSVVGGTARRGGSARSEASEPAPAKAETEEDDR